MDTQAFVAKSFSRRHLLFVPAVLAADTERLMKEETRLKIKSGIKAGSRYALGFP